MGKITKSTKRAPLIAGVALCVAGLICCIIFLVTSFKKADLSNDMTNLQNHSLRLQYFQQPMLIFPKKILTLTNFRKPILIYMHGFIFPERQ